MIFPAIRDVIKEVAKVDGVTNVTSTFNDCTLKLTVTGGADIDIAKAVWLKKPTTVDTRGDISVKVKCASSGYNYTINFSRPKQEKRKMKTKDTTKHDSAYECTLSMFKMQDSINEVASGGENWREKDKPWYRAVFMETAELMDQCGWKWWKKQEFNGQQAQLELVDIWHFGMSIILQNMSREHFIHHKNDRKENQHLKEDFENTLDHKAIKLVATVLSLRNTMRFKKTFILERLEIFAQETLKNADIFDVKGFAELMYMFDLDFSKLFALYTAKNALNHFRQENGYASGHYVKVWDGLSDNEHLMNIIHRLNWSDSRLFYEVKDQLTYSYSKREQPCQSKPNNVEENGE